MVEKTEVFFVSQGFISIKEKGKCCFIKTLYDNIGVYVNYSSHARSNPYTHCFDVLFVKFEDCQGISHISYSEQMDFCLLSFNADDISVSIYENIVKYITEHNDLGFHELDARLQNIFSKDYMEGKIRQYLATETQHRE